VRRGHVGLKRGLVDVGLVEGTLEMSVGAKVRGALAVATRTAAGQVLRGAFGMSEVRIADPAFAGLVVSSADPAWAAHLLSAPALRDLALRATHEPTGQELRVFALRPGAVRLTRRHAQPESLAAEVPAMVELLAAAADAAESLPPPAAPVPLTEMERLSRSTPVALAVKIVGAVLGAVLLVVVLGTAAVLALTPPASSPVRHDPGVGSPVRRHRR
jgi:hypothetical protein